MCTLFYLSLSLSCFYSLSHPLPLSFPSHTPHTQRLALLKDIYHSEQLIPKNTFCCPCFLHFPPSCDKKMLFFTILVFFCILVSYEEKKMRYIVYLKLYIYILYTCYYTHTFYHNRVWYHGIDLHEKKKMMCILKCVCKCTHIFFVWQDQSTCGTAF